MPLHVVKCVHFLYDMLLASGKMRCIDMNVRHLKCLEKWFLLCWNVAKTTVIKDDDT